MSYYFNYQLNIFVAASEYLLWVRFKYHFTRISCLSFFIFKATRIESNRVARVQYQTANMLEFAVADSYPIDSLWPLYRIEWNVTERIRERMNKLLLNPRSPILIQTSYLLDTLKDQLSFCILFILYEKMISLSLRMFL